MTMKEINSYEKIIPKREELLRGVPQFSSTGVNFLYHIGTLLVPIFYVAQNLESVRESKKL